jgi:uncharacterized protein YjhX (UPF0386 family)
MTDQTTTTTTTTTTAPVAAVEDGGPYRINTFRKSPKDVKRYLAARTEIWAVNGEPYRIDVTATHDSTVPDTRVYLYNKEGRVEELHSILGVDDVRLAVEWLKQNRPPPLEEVSVPSEDLVVSEPVAVPPSSKSPDPISPKPAPHPPPTKPPTPPTPTPVPSCHGPRLVSTPAGRFGTLNQNRPKPKPEPCRLF